MIVTGDPAPTPGGALPLLLSIEVTRQLCGRRGRGWVYERISEGDFESITDGGRRLVLTQSVLHYIERKRAEARGPDTQMGRSA